MGTAGAVARASDASTAIHNPAGMTRLDDHQLAVGIVPGYGFVEFDPDTDTPVPGSALNPDDDWVGRKELTEISLLTVTAAPTVAVRPNSRARLAPECPSS